MAITGIAYSTACRSIQELNKELKEKGIKTYRGKISKKYYYEKYGISDKNAC